MLKTITATWSYLLLKLKGQELSSFDTTYFSFELGVGAKLQHLAMKFGPLLQKLKSVNDELWIVFWKSYRCLSILIWFSSDSISKGSFIFDGYFPSNKSSNPHKNLSSGQVKLTVKSLQFARVRLLACSKLKLKGSHVYDLIVKFLSLVLNLKCIMYCHRIPNCIS